MERTRKARAIRSILVLLQEVDEEFI